ncbi:hypothetical protein ACFQJ7_13815 [Halovenus rubra]|uniref:Uncharacterized protein n=2 Tax=Halovenus rubra TaxID=869890 RepID=A0ACC7DYX7_9EURY|nr:hypothetical protein [Halovenus rubra]
MISGVPANAFAHVHGIVEIRSVFANDLGTSGKITAEVIWKAIPEAKTKIQQQTTDKRIEHQQVVYDIIASSEKIIRMSCTESTGARRAEDPADGADIRLET